MSTGTMPVWNTVNTILSHCWKHAGLAVKYAALPVASIILLDLAIYLAGLDSNYWFWKLFTGLIALALYAPFTVTWFESIVFGDDKARTRPVFAFGRHEQKVFLANIRVAFATIALMLLPAILAAVFAFTPSAYSSDGAWFLIAFITLPILFFLLMLITRLSVAIAYAAAGEPISLLRAWQLTAPMAFAITWAHIILLLFGVLIAAAFILPAKILGLETRGDVTSIVITAVGGMFYLLLATTLFAFIYRHLNPTAADATIPV